MKATDLFCTFIQYAFEVSVKSWFLTSCYLLNTVLMTIVLVIMNIFIDYGDELFCDCDEDIREQFYNHCWNKVNTSEAWKILNSAIFGQVFLLCIPFVLWRIYDKKFLIRVMKEKTTTELLTEFFQDSLHGHKWYVFAYHTFETLSVLAVTGVLFGIYKLFGVSPLNVMEFILDFIQGNQGTTFLASQFPVEANCTMKINAIEPGTFDIISSTCSLKLNKIRLGVFIAIYLWTAALQLGGLLQTAKTIIFLVFRTVRVKWLVWCGGVLGPRDSLKKLGYRLPYADYFIFLAICNLIPQHQFNGFARSLALSLYSISFTMQRVIEASDRDYVREESENSSTTDSLLDTSAPSLKNPEKEKTNEMSLQIV